MKIGFFELEGWEEEIIKRGLPDHELSFSKEKLNELHPSAQKDFDIIAVFVDSRITEEVLKDFPNLKFLTTMSTGFDHIDLGAASKRGIAVGYVPGYGDNTVAEFAFGLLLNLTRKIYQSIDQIKESGSFSLNGLRGVDLKGKTIGIIGTGRIGKEAVKIANGFGMNVIAYDPMPDQKFAVESRFRYVQLEELLSSSDVVTIHCPYNKQTHHLLNRGNLKNAKRGAYLVNTARGSIVETEALIEALNEGILRGAALDVLEEEEGTKEELSYLNSGRERLQKMLENHALMRMPNVLITPHIAFNSQEALERILNITIANIKSFIEGKPINLAR